MRLNQYAKRSDEGVFTSLHQPAFDPHLAVGLDPDRIARRKAKRVYFETFMQTRGINLTQFAARVACSHSYISRIVSGDRTPSLDTTVHLAKFMEVPLQQLADVLVGEGEPGDVEVDGGR